MSASDSSAASSKLHADLEEELATTRRFLARYPDDKGSWRPHAKSRTLGELATHLSAIPGRGTNIVETDGTTVGARQAPPSLDSAAELLAKFDAEVEGLRRALGSVAEADLEGEWSLRAGDRVIVHAPKRILLRRMVLSHMIHHRAQLGVYYRLLDVPVPSSYGPTADEPVA